MSGRARASQGDQAARRAAARIIPLELEVVGHIARLFDIGFEATLYGPVSSSGASERSTSQADLFGLNGHYAHLRQFEVWAGGRF